MAKCTHCGNKQLRKREHVNQLNDSPFNIQPPTSHLIGNPIKNRNNKIINLSVKCGDLAILSKAINKMELEPHYICIFYYLIHYIISAETIHGNKSPAPLEIFYSCAKFKMSAH